MNTGRRRNISLSLAILACILLLMGCGPATPEPPRPGEADAISKITQAMTIAEGLVTDVKAKYTDTNATEYTEAKTKYRNTVGKFTAWRNLLTTAIIENRDFSNDEGYKQTSTDARDAFKDFEAYVTSVVATKNNESISPEIMVGIIEGLVQIGIDIWNANNVKEQKDREFQANNLRTMLTWKNWEDIKNTVALQVIHLDDYASTAQIESTELSSDGNNGVAGTDETLPWMGDDNDKRGFVRLDDNVSMEDGSTQNALIMHPKWVPNGSVKMWFKSREFRVTAHTQFIAQVGFVASKNSGGVSFSVWEHHQEEGRETWNSIAEVSKQFDRSLQTIQADLSDLAGKDVYIELRVDAGESPDGDWAAWIDPRIEFSN